MLIGIVLVVMCGLAIVITRRRAWKVEGQQMAARLEQVTG
jgi:Tfp pilus assembly protein PilN